MSKKKCTLKDLLELFEDAIDPSDVLASKIMAQVSTSITRERLKLHMNQSQFAEYIHASQSLVSRWEQGNYNFSVKKIAEIAAILDLDVNISLCSSSIQRTKSSVEYTGNAHYTNTIRFNKQKQNYTVKRYFNNKPKTLNALPKNKEENNYATIC